MSVRLRLVVAHFSYYIALSMRDCIHRFRICTYEYVHVDVYRGPVFAQCGYCDCVSRPLPASIVRHTRLGTTCSDDHHLGCIHVKIQKRTKVNTENWIELVDEQDKFGKTKNSAKIVKICSFAFLLLQMLVGL